VQAVSTKRDAEIVACLKSGWPFEKALPCVLEQSSLSYERYQLVVDPPGSIGFLVFPTLTRTDSTPDSS